MEPVEKREGFTPPPGALLGERSIRELLQELMSEGQHLVRQELALAKAEVKEEARELLKSARNVALGAVLAHTALLALVACLCLALATAMPAWAAVLVVGVALAAAGGAFIYFGVRRARAVRAVAPETKQTLEEDRRWAKRTMRDVRSNVRARA